AARPLAADNRPTKSQMGDRIGARGGDIEVRWPIARQQARDETRLLPGGFIPQQGHMREGLESLPRDRGNMDVPIIRAGSVGAGPKQGQLMPRTGELARNGDESNLRPPVDAVQPRKR